MTIFMKESPHLESKPTSVSLVILVYIWPAIYVSRHGLDYDVCIVYIPIYIILINVYIPLQSELIIIDPLSTQNHISSGGQMPEFCRKNKNACFWQFWAFEYTEFT